ncbi:MAG: hypothetical protein ABWY93_02065 [Mycobacterium sp.]
MHDECETSARSAAEQRTAPSREQVAATITGSYPNFVVVRAGSAGCDLAARPFEDHDLRVLLLESEPEDSKLEIAVPGAWLTLCSTEVDCAYNTIPQAGISPTNTNAPTIMIGETAADLIRLRHVDPVRAVRQRTQRRTRQRELPNMWGCAPQVNLWVVNGNLSTAQRYSRDLAMEIRVRPGTAASVAQCGVNEKDTTSPTTIAIASPSTVISAGRSSSTASYGRNQWSRSDSLIPSDNV